MSHAEKNSQRRLLTYLVSLAMAILLVAPGCDSQANSPDPPVPDAGAGIVVTLSSAAPQEPGILLGQGEIFGAANWWGPGTAGLLFVDHLIDNSSGLGTLRFSTEPMYQAWSDGQQGFVDAIQSPELATALELLRLWYTHGKRVYINLFTPAWLADQDLYYGLPEHLRPSSLIFAPPTDLGRYETEALPQVVAFLRDAVGPGLSYEIWNEPNSYWIAPTEELFAFYAASVRAIRRGDPTARIGGLSMAGDARFAVIEQDPDAGDRPTLERWIEFCAATPVDATETRLPIDFVTYHDYNLAPRDARHRLQPETIRQWLVQSGYPGDVPLLNTEWNYNVFDDTRSHNINTSHVGAAHAAATLMHFHRAGLVSHNVQSLIDLGEPGGTTNIVSHLSTASGVPRASYRALEMLDQLQGEELSAEVDNPWAHAVPFLDEEAQTLRVVIAVYTPSEEQSQAVILQELYAANGDLLQRFGASPEVELQGLLAYVKGEISQLSSYWLDALSADEEAIVEEARHQYRVESDQREAWGIGPEKLDALQPVGGGYVQIPLRLRLGDLPTPTTARVARLDSTEVINQTLVEELDASLDDSALDAACSAAYQALPGGTVCPELDEVCQGGVLTLSTDLFCASASGLAFEFSSRLSIWQTQGLLVDAGGTAAQLAALADAYAAALQAYQTDYDAMWQSPPVQLAFETREVQEDDTGEVYIDLTVEPYSVLLIELGQ